MPPETSRLYLPQGGEVQVRGEPPVADPCPFVARVDAHLRTELGGALGFGHHTTTT